MKKIILFCLLCLCLEKSFAQKQSFDLATFTLPKGWKKQVTENAMHLSKEDKATGNYCLIILYKSIPGAATPSENFNLAWTSLVKEMVTVSGNPELHDPEIKNGWETHSGHAPFTSDDGNGVAILATATGTGKMMNMLVLTNTGIYEKEMTSFLASFSLKKIPPPEKSSASQIVNTWSAVSSDQDAASVNNGVAGHIHRQYIFNSNGTYRHIVKTFSYFSDLLLTQETGTYTVSGNTVTVTPQQASIESWSKKDNKDEWGKRLTSQKAVIEKASYQFTIEYLPSINETQLILQNGKATKRDGHFHQGNKWFYKLATKEYHFIKLPG